MNPLSRAEFLEGLNRIHREIVKEYYPMKVIVSDTAPVLRPGEVWKKPTGEYRMFTGGGWVPPSEEQMKAIRTFEDSEKAAQVPTLNKEPLDPRQTGAFADVDMDDVCDRLEAVGFQLTHANLSEGTSSVQSKDGNVGRSFATPGELVQFLEQLEILAAKKELSEEDAAKLLAARRNPGE